MPKDEEDTKPGARVETQKMPPTAPVDVAEVAAASDQLAMASLTVSDEDIGTITTRTVDADADMRTCSSCGKAGDALKKCTACKCVWYCDVFCQKAHRKEHKKECKRMEKQLREQGSAASDASNAHSKDEQDPELFKPHPPTEDCPVCLVPLPIEGSEKTYWGCCGKVICLACVRENERALRVTNMKRKKKELPPLEVSCAFCRTPMYKGQADCTKRCVKRISKGDSEAMYTLADDYRKGGNGLRRDEAESLRLTRRAADLGHVDAMASLGVIYAAGECGVVKDATKGRHYFESAVKGGSVNARSNLAGLEFTEGNTDRAIRHLRLAAAAGAKNAMKLIWKFFYEKLLNKVDLESTLRAHKDACDEMNSEDRERLAAYMEAEEGDDDMLKGMYNRYYGGVFNAKELKKALKCKQGGTWNVAESNKVLEAAKARLRAEGCI